MRPIKSYLHKLGCDSSVFIDDGLNIGDSYFKAFANYRFTIYIMGRAGWTFQPLKCSTQPTQVIQYLGYVLNSKSMTISVPELKCKQIVYLANHILDLHTARSSIPCKLLASYLGKCAHMIPSHNNFTRIMTRQGHG